MNVNTQENKQSNVKRDSILSKIIKGDYLKRNTQAVILKEKEEDYELIENIKTARNEWINANMNFEFAKDPGPC